MSYYHVYIYHYDTIKSGTDEAYELDLSEEELMEQIVEPFRAGKFFMCGGQQINPFYVELIRISETDKRSSELISKLRAKEIEESEKTGISGGVPDNYLVIEKGRDVTRKFVSTPPKREVSEKEAKTKQSLSKNIFIVHGRDHEPMKDLKSMLYDFGLDPIVLHEEASGGLTLAEKLEKYSDSVRYAFVILTPDDAGSQRTEVEDLKSRLESPPFVAIFTESHGVGQEAKISRDFIKKEFERLKPRARQNAIFEMGYFWGLLKRRRVCCLLKEDVEKPSDIEGIVYIPFKNSVNEVQVKIMKELKEAGYEIKL